MEANKCDVIVEGTACSWNTQLNGKIVRLTGIIKRVPKDKSFPYNVLGIDFNGTKHEDMVYLDDKSFEVFPPFKTLEENKLTHELAALLASLGSDILKRDINLILDKTIQDLYFSTSEELTDLLVRLLNYEIEPWKVCRLCAALYTYLK